MTTKIPVKAFMRKDVETLMPLNTIEDAAKRFYKKNVGSLVILEDDVPVGIITEKDLVAGTLVFGNKKDTKIKKIMTRPIVFIEPDTSIIEAAEIMIKKGIHKLPVIYNGRLVGIISSTDLVVIFSMGKEEDLVKILGPHIEG